jgi:carboxyl-terminal processing protease
MFSDRFLLSYLNQKVVKMSRFFKIFLTVGLLFATGAQAQLHSDKSSEKSTDKSSDKASLECRYVYPIEQGFLANHVKYSNLDKELEGRVFDQYLKRVDSAKIYLTQADVEEVKKIMTGQFKKSQDQDCTFLGKVQDILIQRVKERAEFAKTFLGKDYKFDPKTEFVYDPDKKPWPKTKDEANEFLKKYVHFQVSNYLATDMKLPEAKKAVVKNYDRAVKRTVETSQNEIYAGYLDSFARSLDPHSSYMSRDIWEDFRISMELKLQGIGATLSSQDGFTIVEALVPGGAAARSGQIEPQDKIIAVGQADAALENVIDMDLKDVVKKIRGPKGTKVHLSILRSHPDGKKRLDVMLTRDEVKLEDEAASITYVDKDLNGQKKKIGIINLPSFYAESHRGGRTCADDMKKLVKQARDNKVDGMVLDLSNNGGGSLDDAVRVAGLFFKTGNVVKQSSKNEGHSEIVFADTDSTVDWPGPMVVLTSRISASASEIVAGTLQDYKRAVIVGGDHTFGKGSVQTVRGVPNDLGAVKVTIGMFFIPGGNSTQHRGVEADVVLPGPFSTEDIGEKSLDYSLPPKKIDNFVSESAYVKEGEGTWNPIKSDWVKTLKDKSHARVDKNEEFKKIIEDLAKAKERGKIIKVSDVLKDKEKIEKEKKKSKNRYAKKEEKDKEYLKRADVQEATNVLLDLMNIEDPQATPQARK